MAASATINLIRLINEQNDRLNLQKNDQHYQDNREDNPISELQMHKMLYLLYGLFYQEYNLSLFKDAKFEAWKYGPVEIDYRIAYHKQTFDQVDKFNIEINPYQKKFLEKTINQLLRHSPWYLIDITHQSMAWYKNFDDSQPWSKNKISIEDIHQHF